MRKSALALSVFLGSIAFAGGPSIEIDELEVYDVAVVRDKIIVRASGTIRQFTRKTREERTSPIEAKWVSLDAEDIVWTIHKPLQNVIDGQKEIRENWETYCERAKEWEEQTVRGQLWDTEISIVNGRLETMSSKVHRVHIIKSD